jgi:hypothetical protein
MHRPTLWRQAPRLVLPAALVVLALAACGGGSQGGGGGGAQDSAESGKENPLVGTWRRERKCDEQVRSMEEAGLAELIPEWVSPSEFAHVSSAQSLGPSEDPCRGVKDGNLPHDHVFYEDGRFASLDDQGEFVDDGTYKLTDDRTVVLGDDPPAGGPTAHFRFSNNFDTVTFDVVIPDMDTCSERCRESTAYGIAVFYPGLPWQRVAPKDQWPGEE